MRLKRGIVTSAKSNKTAVILVHSEKMHPVLGKSYRVSKKFHAHDENNECKIGDEVVISETRPISKLKRWKIDKILVKAAEDIKLKDDLEIIKESKPVIEKPEVDEVESKDKSNPEEK